jgi:threonine/homoserine/homoserine lactone efflux protein
MPNISIISQFGLAWSAYFLATASPGPGVMAIIGTSAQAGRKAGICLALGILSGSITWAILTLAGMSTLIQQHPEALFGIKILGGAYLLWLGANALKRAVRQQGMRIGEGVSDDRSIRHYLRGYGVHITNPKAVMVWIMLASLALPANADLSLALAFVIGCMLIGATVFLSYALLFSMPSVLAAYQRLARPIEATMALVFGYAGATLLLGVL